MSSHHSDQGGRSAKRKLRRHHARSYTASYIPSVPQPDYFQRSHVGNFLFGRQKSTKTEELICVRRKQEQPYTAVTVAIEHLCDEKFEHDDSAGIIELAEAIKLQATGPKEAARALRKKLKYGTPHRQLRALEVLDSLVQNAGRSSRFEQLFDNDALLERLRICATSNLSDPAVKAKCKQLFLNWSVNYKDVNGMQELRTLYKVLILKTS